MNLVERAVSPTPTFFQKLRNIGLALAAISAAIIASPVTCQPLWLRSQVISPLQELC